jgi:hypothetical protein
MFGFFFSCAKAEPALSKQLSSATPVINHLEPKFNQLDALGVFVMLSVLNRW